MAEENDFLEPLPFDDDDEPSPSPPRPQQHPRSEAAGGLQSPSFSSSREGNQDLYASDDDDAEVSHKIKTFASESKLEHQEATYNRPLNTTGQGATRCKVFHAKLNDGALEFMTDHINEWIDSNPDIEVKFSQSTIGEVVGKRTEPHLIVTVWY